MRIYTQAVPTIARRRWWGLRSGKLDVYVVAQDGRNEEKIVSTSKGDENQT